VTLHGHATMVVTVTCDERPRGESDSPAAVVRNYSVRAGRTVVSWPVDVQSPDA
jgi:hypothetical protein